MVDVSYLKNEHCETKTGVALLVNCLGEQNSENVVVDMGYLKDAHGEEKTGVVLFVNCLGEQNVVIDCHVVALDGKVDMVSGLRGVAGGVNPVCS